MKNVTRQDIKDIVIALIQSEAAGEGGPWHSPEYTHPETGEKMYGDKCWAVKEDGSADYSKKQLNCIMHKTRAQVIVDEAIEIAKAIGEVDV